MVYSGALGKLIHEKTRSRNLVTLSLEMNEYMNILPTSLLSLPLMGYVLPRVRWPVKIVGFMYSSLCHCLWSCRPAYFFPTHQLLCPSSTLQCVGCPEPLLNALQLFPFRTGSSNDSGNCALRVGHGQKWRAGGGQGQGGDGGEGHDQGSDREAGQ